MVRDDIREVIEDMVKKGLITYTKYNDRYSIRDMMCCSEDSECCKFQVDSIMEYMADNYGDMMCCDIDYDKNFEPIAKPFHDD